MKKYWVCNFSDSPSVVAKNNLEEMELTDEEYNEIKDDCYIFDNYEEALKFAKGGDIYD